MLRLRTVVVLLGVIALAIWLWQDGALQRDRLNTTPTTSAKPGVAASATESDGRIPIPASTGAAAGSTLATPATTHEEAPASTAGPARTAPGVPVRLDVYAPPSARAGDRFTIRIDAEAFGGIRNLSFGVSYDRDTLQFVSSSPGSFVQLASAPAKLMAEDTSSGDMLVNLDIGNGGVVAAAGTVVLLEFSALRAGTSPITVHDVSFLDGGQSGSSTAAVVRSASIIIE